MAERSFGVSTHLFHRLASDARAPRPHRGARIRRRRGVRDALPFRLSRRRGHRSMLAEWLSDTRLTLHSMHAPIFEALKGGQWVGPFSNATDDEKRRAAALAETRAALAVASATSVSLSGRPSGDTVWGTHDGGRQSSRRGSTKPGGDRGDGGANLACGSPWK